MPPILPRPGLNELHERLPGWRITWDSHGRVFRARPPLSAVFPWIVIEGRTPDEVVERTHWLVDHMEGVDVAEVRPQEVDTASGHLRVVHG